ncbi:MAG: regulatory protein RecX [Nitrospiraceae bacterium]|nr:regulatory protein RecX [Nitrospiraceae bacterium]
MRYLARWDRTVAQVEQHLIAKGATPALVRQTTGRLSDLGYLNDRTYAERWVERRLARQAIGPARLKAELQARGIPASLAEDVIAKASADVDEETQARRALELRQRKGRRTTLAQAQQFLRQRGFEDEVIGRMIKAMGQEPKDGHHES